MNNPSRKPNIEIEIERKTIMQHINARPEVGRIVHYTAPGSADGTYPCVCRPAMVVESADQFLATLMVINPTGVHFRANVAQSAGDPTDDAPGSRCWAGARAYPGLTWHWPERQPN